MNSTIQTYDKYHEVYDSETTEFWEKFPKEIIIEFKKYTKGSRILNIGSGPGRDAILLRDEGLDVTCLDGSKEMVIVTTKLGFNSIVQDLRKLKFSENSFDGVWAFTSLLHIKKDELQRVLQDIRRIIKGDGVFLIGMIEGEFEGEVQRASMPGSSRYFRYYSAQELIQLIEKSGFTFRYQKKYIPNKNAYLCQVYTIEK